jgi:catechol 2,3-dioxygenase-like lactoylglutathione lyase family enzyme
MPSLVNAGWTKLHQQARRHFSFLKIQNTMSAAAAHADQKVYPPILADEDAKPAVRVLRFHSLGLAVCSLPATTAFYALLGFTAASSDTLTLKHATNGLQLHLCMATDLSHTDNWLMDNASSKAPGHTHASWAVPSVPGMKTFLERLAVPLSGTRGTLAVFVRDPDRTTLEFERNDGGDDASAVFSSDMIGSTKPLDHVGIRTRAPHRRHLEFYARNFGFTRLVRFYDVDPDPLKNGSPMITRTETNCDVNFIPNANTEAEDGNEATENLLLPGNGVIRPGILYAAFTIGDGVTAEQACERLQANGVDAVLDTELEEGGLATSWADFPPSALRLLDSGPTVMARDLNGTFIRLVPELEA